MMGLTTLYALLTKMTSHMKEHSTAYDLAIIALIVVDIAIQVLK